MLSIIIPTLNEEERLPRLLDCLKSQKPEDCEIIVSDGQSKDRTVETANRFGCRTVVNPPKNPARQRNEGAKIARGNLLLFLDADTLLPDHFLENVLKEFEDRRLDVAGFYFKFHSDKLKYRIASSWWKYNFWMFHFFYPMSIGAAILADKSFHEKTGGFDESLYIGEDHFYSKKIKKAGGKYGLIKSDTIIYSTRRFEKEGFLKVNLKWYIASINYLIFGHRMKKIVKYEFNNR
ncbi:MAG TPA: glycosyltransferase [Candidatus Bipolaricaulota bacterium]|nr:glycosyltransferase [Candidatus Bipolaricaulota bacterium]